jgi:DNA polymerase-3 subunit delta'
MTTNKEKLWQAVVGHEYIKTGLKQAIYDNKLSHAYLFCGPEGVGKRQVAEALAASLNCLHKSGCGECRSCRLVTRKIHPQFHIVEPEGNYILLHQIKNLQKFANLKVEEDKTKVVIIDDCSLMNLEAANRLLKILEEPPPQTIFILISGSPELVLETIRSRCQLVRFHNLRTNQIAHYLSAQYHLSDHKADEIAKLSQGKVSLALEMMTESDIFSTRNWLVDKLVNLNWDSYFDLFSLTDAIVEKLETARLKLKVNQEKKLKALTAVTDDKKYLATLVKHQRLLQKRAESRLYKQKLDEYLSIIISLFRDMLLLIEGGEHSWLINKSASLEVSRLAARLGRKRCFKAINYLFKAEQEIQANVSHKLVLDTLLINLQEVF